MRQNLLPGTCSWLLFLYWHWTPSDLYALHTGMCLQNFQTHRWIRITMRLKLTGRIMEGFRSWIPKDWGLEERCAASAHQIMGSTDSLYHCYAPQKWKWESEAFLLYKKSGKHHPGPQQPRRWNNPQLWEENKKFLPTACYSLRWNIEISYYEGKTFCSLEEYRVRSRVGIERLVNLECIAYSAMALLPYRDGAFSCCRSASAQETRFGIGQQIQASIIFSSFVELLETVKKSSVIY